MKRSSSVLRNITSSWALLITVSICQLVQVPIALKALGKEEFGLFAVVSQLLAMLMYVELGVTAAFSRLLIDGISQGRERYQTVWASGFFLLICQASVIFIAVLGIAPFIDRIFNIPPSLHTIARAIFLAAGALTAVRYALNIFSVTLFANQRLSMSNVIGIAGIIIQLVVFVIVIWMGLGLWAYIWSLIATSAFSVLTAIIYCKKSAILPPISFSRVTWHEIKSIFSLGLDVIFISFFNVFMFNSPLIFAGHLLSLEETAVLAVNFKVFSLAYQILHRMPGSADPTFMSLISHHELERFRFGWAVIAKLAINSVIFAGGFLFLASPLMIRWWTSPAMVMSTGATFFLCLMPLRFMIHSLFVSSLVMFKEIRLVRFSLVWEALVYSGLTLFLGKRYGLSGLLAGVVLSLPLGAIWRGGFQFSKLSGFPIRKLVGIILRSSVMPCAGFAILVLATNPATRNNLPKVIAFNTVWAALNAVNFFTLAIQGGERNYLYRFVEKFLPNRAKAG